MGSYRRGGSKGVNSSHYISFPNIVTSTILVQLYPPTGTCAGMGNKKKLYSYSVILNVNTFTGTDNNSNYIGIDLDTLYSGPYR